MLQGDNNNKVHNFLIDVQASQYNRDYIVSMKKRKKYLLNIIRQEKENGGTFKINLQLILAMTITTQFN